MRTVTTSEGAESSDAMWHSKPLPKVPTTGGNLASSAHRWCSLSLDVSRAKGFCTFRGCKVGEQRVMVLSTGLLIHHPCPCSAGEFDTSARQTLQHHARVCSDTDSLQPQLKTGSLSKNGGGRTGHAHLDKNSMRV